MGAFLRATFFALVWFMGATSHMFIGKSEKSLLFVDADPGRTSRAGEIVLSPDPVSNEETEMASLQAVVSPFRENIASSVCVIPADKVQRNFAIVTWCNSHNYVWTGRHKPCPGWHLLREQSHPRTPWNHAKQRPRTETMAMMMRRNKKKRRRRRWM